MNYCEPYQRDCKNTMPYFEILEDGAVVKRFKLVLDDEIEITNELMAIPSITLTLPIDYLEYFTCRKEIKVHWCNCVFYGVIMAMTVDKNEETIELTINHILEKWNWRSTPTNKAVKNKKMPEVFKDKDIVYEEDWNIEFDDMAKEQNIDYVYSRQTKLEALTRTVELTDSLWWRIDFQEPKNVEIGVFGEDSGYTLSTKHTKGRNIRMITNPIITEDYSNVINLATVYSEKNDGGSTSLSLREVYNDPDLQLEGFPVVIIRNYINNERDYDWEEYPKLAPNNELEYAIIDQEGVALECGTFIEGTFAFNDLSPFSEEELTEAGEKAQEIKWIVPQEQRFLTEQESLNNAHAFYNYFRGKWTDLAIASCIGAIWYESGMNPNIYEGLNPNYRPASIEGYGLVGWTPYSRITNWLNERGYKLEDYGIGECKKIEEEWASGRTNAEWIPTASYPETFQQWSQISNQSTQYMVMAWMVDYGRGDTRLDLRYGDRIAKATEILQNYIPKWKGEESDSSNDNSGDSSNDSSNENTQTTNRPSGSGNWDPQTFINTWNGKSSDIDGVAGMQCVDTYKEILKVVGYPNPARPIGGDGYAHQIWYLRNSSGIMQYFDEVQGQPQLGDVAVWSQGGQTPYSHVAMFVKSNGDGTAQFFGQNQPHPYHNTSRISTGNVLGYLRVKDQYWTAEGGSDTTNKQPDDETKSEITDSDRIYASQTAYLAGVKKLKNSRRTYQIEVETDPLPCDIQVGDKMRVYFDNNILKFDNCTTYQKKVLTLNNDFYITSISRVLHKDGSETGKLTLDKYLKIERDTKEK